jgi:hypothetical protein
MLPLGSGEAIFGSDWAEPDQGGKEYEDANDVTNIHGNHAWRG